MSFWGWRPNMWPVKSVHQGALNDRSGSACCIFNMQSRHVISRDLDVAESHCKPHIDCLVRLLAWGKNNLKQPVGFRCLDNSSSFFGGMIYHLILKQLLNEYSNKLCCWNSIILSLEWYMVYGGLSSMYISQAVPPLVPLKNVLYSISIISIATTE